MCSSSCNVDIINVKSEFDIIYYPGQVLFAHSVYTRQQSGIVLHWLCRGLRTWCYFIQLRNDHQARAPLLRVTFMRTAWWKVWEPCALKPTHIGCPNKIDNAWCSFSVTSDIFSLLWKPTHIGCPNKIRQCMVLLQCHFRYIFFTILKPTHIYGVPIK